MAWSHASVSTAPTPASLASPGTAMPSGTGSPACFSRAQLNAFPPTRGRSSVEISSSVLHAPTPSSSPIDCHRAVRLGSDRSQTGVGPGSDPSLTPCWTCRSREHPFDYWAGGTVMTKQQVKTTAFWATTILGPTSFVIGGDLGLMGGPEVGGATRHLGYPRYFVSILRTWKLLGGITISPPGLPRGKEG